MADLSDYPLEKSADEQPGPTEPSSPSRTWWIAALLFVVVVAVASYIVVGRWPTTTPDPSATRPVAATTEELVQPLGGQAQAVEVPALDESDPLVRMLVGALSRHPSVMAWLATDGLIRNFAVVVSNIAEGRSPATHLTALRPSSPFRVVERRGVLYPDPRSYQRYDDVAAAAASIDPDGAAQLYSTLKPRIEEAYRDLGFPDTPFDRTLERAIVLLLQVPASDEPVALASSGLVYAFSDPRVEGLTAAQKLLLRMGPGNVQAIQASLYAVARALGIPARRLPELPST
jgi:hypothetical protein